MARVKINFPTESPLFETTLPVRISDVNYGGHMGNDALLSLLHEARMQFLNTHGLTELNAGGHGIIMADVMIAYRGEAFRGDVLQVKIFADQLSRLSFDLLYLVTTERNGTETRIAEAKTGMVCFDYELRKICDMSPSLKKVLSGAG